MNKDAAKKISQARVWLLISHPFFGYLASSLEGIEKTDMMIKTMATDGKRLYYDPDFVTETPLNQLRGIIAHEVGHCFLLHLPRRKGRDPWKWNLAADFSVNSLVLKEFELPPGCLYKREWDGKEAEYIYNQLEDRTDKSQQTMDDHESWKDWGNDKSENTKGGENGSESGVSEKESGATEQEWREKIAEAAVQARMRGKLPAHLQEIVDGALQPKLDWKAILRDMVTSCVKNDFRLMPPNKKHLWRGFILPGITGNEIKIGACIDTSGSISHETMQEFLSEIKGICEAYEQYTIYLYTADAEVHQEWEITNFTGDLPKNLQGRGGTDFRPAIEKIEGKDVSVFVYLTDGYGAYPDKNPGVPIIWILTHDHQDPPWGQKIILPYK